MIKIDLPLDKMTIADKLAVIEMLWEDLIRESGNIPSPSWHGEILAERGKRVEEGKAEFLDWDAVKAEIRKATC